MPESIARIIGFPPSALGDFATRFPSAKWVAGAPTGMTVAVEEAWVVHPNEAGAVVREGLPAGVHGVVVLSAEYGDSPPDEDWWECFHSVLQLGDPKDDRTLERFARIPYLFEVCEAVEDVDEEWFLRLSGSPRTTVVSELPDLILKTYRGVLEISPDCLDEVRERLQRRAGRVWKAVMPSAEQVAAWLEGEANSYIEQLAPNCQLLQESIRTQGELWLEAGLVTQQQFDRKLAAVAIKPAAVALPVPPPQPARILIALADIGHGWRSVKEWAADLLGSILEGGSLLPDISVAQLGPLPTRSSGTTQSPAAEPHTGGRADAAIGFLNRFGHVKLNTADNSTRLTLTVDPKDCLVLRVRRTAGGLLQEPRVRFMKEGATLAEFIGVLEEDDLDPEGGKLGKVSLSADEIREAMAAGLTAVEVVL